MQKTVWGLGSGPPEFRAPYPRLKIRSLRVFLSKNPHPHLQQVWSANGGWGVFGWGSLGLQHTSPLHAHLARAQMKHGCSEFHCPASTGLVVPLLGLSDCRGLLLNYWPGPFQEGSNLAGCESLILYLVSNPEPSPFSPYAAILQAHVSLTPQLCRRMLQEFL